MSLKVAQTFYVDKTKVRGAEHTTLDSIDLYFKSKPRATGNISGITNPGVTVYVTLTKDDDVPDINAVLVNATARGEYGQIVASADASIKTRFKFANPVVLQTNKAYAIAVAFDGGEEYVLWTCKEGETVVGTNTITSGATAQNVGKFYEYTSGAATGWKALSDTDLKFGIFVATYAANTLSTSISNTYLLATDANEYIMYNRYHESTRAPDALKINELVFQETPVIYGTVKVNANSANIVVNGSNINFSTLFPAPPVSSGTILTNDPVQGQKQYIVLRNGSSSAANVDIIEVKSVASNTVLELERLPLFTNNTATFSITAVGKLTHRDQYFYTGRWFDYTSNTMVRKTGFKSDMISLVDSNANASIRFVNNMLQSITISSGGTGYSNSDVITVYPVTNANTADANHIDYIPSYSNAVANVVTNGSGTITGIAITNAGRGLMAANVALSITTSGGTTANLVPTIGAVLRGATSNSMIGDCVLLNVPVHRSFPQIRVLSNQHHVTRIIQHLPYYVMPNKEHVLVQASTAMKRETDIGQNNATYDYDSNDGRVYVLACRSTEVAMSSNVTIALANGANFATKLKASSIIEIPITSNNAFTIPVVEATQVYNYSYVINNDITNERKGNGRALARHVSEKVTFAENRNAEDIVVYCDVYRPKGTDVTVYARLHSRTDQEAFDDKDWTQLELKSNNGSLTSSLTDEKDLIEFTYGLPACPASVNTIAGDANLTVGQSNVVGIATSWNTDLAVNDVIKLYSPLFPEDFMISVVRSITNSTFMTIDDAVSNVALSATTSKIDLIGRPNDGTNVEIGSPFQAFVYEPNSYICRYYDSAMGKNDTYNTFQVKVVLTSNNESIVPKVHNTRAVGVSA